MKNGGLLSELTARGLSPLGPDDPDYDTLRQVWNGLIDRHPAAILRAKSVSEVQSAVRAAGASGTAVCVRGGGHNIAGSAVADGALMIDMSALDQVNIDPGARIARVAGGATWAGFDAAAQAHGLAAPGGVVSSTGVAGLTLGGGFGWLARRHGLAIDNLLSADVVLADGRQVTCSADAHPELFWAIRGGGGNFGIVTAFSFQLHDVGPDVLFGPSFFALDDAPAVLAAYAEHAMALPGDACVWANLMTAPAVPVLPEEIRGQPVLTLTQFHADRQADGPAVFGPLYGSAVPLGIALAARTYTEAQGFLDTTYAFGARNSWRSHNLTALTAGLIDTIVDLAAHLPTPESEVLICQLGGVVSDVSAAATAFPHRDIPFMITPGVRWQDPAEDVRNMEWLAAASARIARHAAPGAYANFMAETDVPVSRAYGPNLHRLSAVKHRYDPQNLFRFNQNVPPDPEAAAKLLTHPHR